MIDEFPKHPYINSQYIGSSGEALLSSSAGKLLTVIIGIKDTGILTLYDNTEASGKIIATINLDELQGVIDFTKYGVDFDNGLYYVATGSVNYVVVMWS